MIINADVKSLEVVAAAYLSQDPILMKEIHKGVDIHGINQKVFGFPNGKEGRLVAKIFIFRILYGGTSYSFANDPSFQSVSTSQKYWEEVIKKFYEKYQILAKWHIKLIEEVTKNSKLIMPTGREYRFTLTKYGDWPRTNILNFPVQGLGADLVSIIRVTFYKRFKVAGFKGKLIMTVHDSIVVDCPKEEVEEIVKLFNQSVSDTPKLYQAWFGKEFNLPMRCEVSTGPNMADLTETGVL